MNIYTKDFLGFGTFIFKKEWAKVKMVTPKMKVVLVEPEIPFNTGSIGRTCVALDLELILIGQLGFSLDSSSVERSGTRYWQFVEISLYDNWINFGKQSI